MAEADSHQGTMVRTPTRRRSRRRLKHPDVRIHHRREIDVLYFISKGVDEATGRGHIPGPAIAAVSKAAATNVVCSILG